MTNGFSLVRLSDNSEQQFWGSLPDSISIPEAQLSVHGVALGWEADGYRLVSRVIVDPGASAGQMRSGLTIVFDGTQTTATTTYEAMPVDQYAAAQADTLKAQAKTALEASDKVALRCWKKGLAFPADWIAYDDQLRTIASSGTGQFPFQPAYPAGS